jgi:hypothetical protein
MEFKTDKNTKEEFEIEDVAFNVQARNEQEISLTLDKYLEKMVVLKKNFLANHYKTKDLSNQNKSVLSQAELIDEDRIPAPDIQNKSVSTEVSIYQIIDNISNDNLPTNKDNEKFIGNYNYSQYLQKLNKYFKSFLGFIQKEKVKLDLKYVNYLIGIFVVNHVFQQEIDMTFRFFSSLVDVSLSAQTQGNVPEWRIFLQDLL